MEDSFQKATLWFFIQRCYLRQRILGIYAAGKGGKGKARPSEEDEVAW